MTARDVFNWLNFSLLTMKSVPAAFAAQFHYNQYIHTHTHTYRLMALCPGLPTRVSRYQNSKTDLDFTEARDSE